MIRGFARQLLGPRAIELDHRRSSQRSQNVSSLRLLESQSREETACVLSKQVKMPRAASVRGLARRRDQRAPDSAPAHRFIHAQRSYQRRIDLRFDPNHPDRLIAHVRNDVTRRRPLDSLRHHAAPLQHPAHQPKVARLLDHQLARAMLANRHARYFFGGGNSCTPAWSTTVIALTGHERAAATITASPAPAASISSDLPAASN